MDFWVIVYILLCVAVGGGAVSYFYKRQETTGAMVAMVLLILVFVFYGLRWFEAGELKGTKSPSGDWPPIVNACPDYMALYKHTDNKVYCYDAGNIYGLKSVAAGNAGTVNPKITINGVPDQSAYLIKDASGNNILKTTLNDVIADQANGKYVKWEGVWDGQSMNTSKVPKV
jgi:hypothetical protein